MAYTSANLADVQAARLALAQGTRVVRVTVDGKVIEYGQSDDDKLARLEAKIESALAEAARAASSTVRRRYFMLKSEKGL